MVFSNFQMQEDLANNANDLQLQLNEARYDRIAESSLQSSTAAGGGGLFGAENNSLWPPRSTLGGHPSAFLGSQINAGMLGSFAHQQALSQQSQMEDNLLATIQNQQHQFLPPSFQNMMGGSSLQHLANSSSLGSGLGVGGLFGSNFPSSSIAGEASILNGSQLDSGFLPNNNHAIFLQQQQQQFQFEQQQQWLLQQQQLQQQIQQNQAQLQQLQRQPIPDFQPRLPSPSISTTNSPIARPVTTLGKVDDIHAVRPSARARPAKRSTSTVLKSAPSKVKSFPEKLMQAMLENRNEDAVGWLPDGKSFVIVSPDKFVNHVLKHEFKHIKYASFVRKLHRWGFVRLTSGTGTDCFHHPLFQKNRKDLASKIKSISNDPTKKGQPPYKLSSSKPPSLAGVDKFVRARAIINSVSSAAQTDPEVASIRSDVSDMHVPESELVEL